MFKICCKKIFDDIIKKDRLKEISMKKFIALLTLFIFLATNVASAIVDVPEDYWAIIEIKDMVNNDVIPLDQQGYFNPEESVFRTDFTGWLLKVLQQGAPTIVEDNPFLDVDPNTRGYHDILKSKEVGLVYGYPDGNFRPVKNLSRAETQSIMSHITKELFDDLSPLDPFVDKNEIPFWDMNQYAKTIYLGLYVNHPQLEKLEPNRDLTRAEAAVLLYRLKIALNLVKDEYKVEEEVPEEPVEQIIGNEQLVCDKCGAAQNDVTITNQRRILLPGNIFSIKYNQDFASKASAVGDPVAFKLDYDLMTVQGTLMLPRDTELIGEVQTITDPKWFNKNARVFLEIKEIRTPDGKVIPTKAIVYNSTEGYLMEGPGKTMAKVAGYAVGGMAVGAGAGVGIGAGTKNWGTSLGVAIPVGAAIGVAGGLIAPGLNYKAHPGEKIYIEVRDETSIWNN